ncbi:hypothetical protein AB7783_21695 [Tardiphaga sp. 172_B4_N1_3]|uniref:hypothetical protein n=1 Tax=Tardiphaga sp. 172_B4_N1_3 TaxID=3240787 RepID=UPI003F8C300D
MPLQKGQTCGRHLNDGTMSGDVQARRESTVDAVFPHRQSWARCPPRIEHVGIGSGFARDPFQEIKDQGIEVMGNELKENMVMGHGAVCLPRSRPAQSAPTYAIDTHIRT